MANRSLTTLTRGLSILTVVSLLVACSGNSAASGGAGASGGAVASGGAAASGAAPGNETTLQRIKREKLVTVGFVNEPPYNFAESGKLTGGYPEALRAFFATIDPEIKMDGVLTEFSALIPGLVAKQFDINGGGMNIRTTRCAQIAFANPEVQAIFVFIVKKGNPMNLHTFKDIATTGARYGAVTGAAEVEVADAVGIAKDKQTLFPDAPALVAGLQANRVDVIAATSLAATDIIKKTNDPNIELVVPTEIPLDKNGKQSVGYVAIGMRKEDQDLVDAYNKWQTEAKKSGKLLEIMAPFGFTAADMAPVTVTAEEVCKDS